MSFTRFTCPQAVLCPTVLHALHATNSEGSNKLDHAQDIIRLIVQAIIITTPIGFLCTKYLGLRIFRKDERVEDGTDIKNW